MIACLLEQRPEADDNVGWGMYSQLAECRVGCAEGNAADTPTLEGTLNEKEFM